ncbi:hypothetical protein LAZ67_X001569 [Cordylochernes scorpioides]|uniref:Reverse transcriptase domain-containing protein n=1 Tax=Cordylochernes scorpioides TaxID=51811 RepID=A0ABY6LSL3_9ARAC|nr:hypothetical protein LAZ67_X001569 [Cordylochernes scorpioides]
MDRPKYPPTNWRGGGVKKEISEIDSRYHGLLLEDETITEVKIEEEFEGCENYVQGMFDIENKYLSRCETARVRVDGSLVESAANSVVNTESKRTIRLPKVELPKFKGNLEDWLSWWGQFSKINDDETLGDVDKFHSLLQAVVEGSRAQRLVCSYPITEFSYPKVIQALKDGFGDKNLLIEHYIRRLLKLVVSNARKENIPLDEIYDDLMAHLKNLESLGVNTEMAGMFLYPLVESSLPLDIIQVWQRNPAVGYGIKEEGAENGDKSDASGRLQALMDFLRDEVKGAERMAFAKENFEELSNHINPYPPIDIARQQGYQHTQLKHDKDKQKFDLNHKTPNFEIGDLVLVKEYHHLNTGKLTPYLTGPYTILEVISPNVVKINRPNQPLNKEHDTIHVNKLRPYTESVPHIAPPTMQAYFVQPKDNDSFPFRHLAPDLFRKYQLPIKPSSSQPLPPLTPNLFTLIQIEPTSSNSYQISSKIKFGIKEKKVEKKARKIIHDCKNFTSTHNIFHEKINMKELDYALENTDLNKTPGPDGIHGQMILNLGKNGKERLLDIFNNSWKTGKLPQDWKTATIIPIKKLDKSADDPKNYRPISLTSICCKLMEKIILRRLTYHLDTRNLLPEEQYGFRKGHGTIDQLLFFTQKVKDAQNGKPTNHTIAAFLDLTQAFDKVW